MTIEVGEVIAVNGIKVTIRVFEESSKDTLYYEGEKFKGVSIREYISIQRGFRSIVCIIEGEHLDDRNFEVKGNKRNYIRKIDAKPIGYFEQNQFYDGIKFLPMIKDVAYLMQESKISEIYSKGSSNGFVIGKMLKEDIPISLPWDKLFNSHIAIFGNTGSGKSNTLAKIYSVLFDKMKDNIVKKSQFVLLDFNGEYTTDQLVQKNYKNVLHLSTRNNEKDRLTLSSSEFWNAEILSILFKATTNTQRPFLNRLINNRKKYIGNENSILSYYKSTFKAVFTMGAPKPELLDLLRYATDIVNDDTLIKKLQDIRWNGNSFYYKGSWFDSDGVGYETAFKKDVVDVVLDDLDSFDELILRSNLQLVWDLINGFVQFEHIQPLLKRVESSLSNLRNVIEISDDSDNNPLLTVISLRECNQEIKKIIPLLVANHYYNSHKNSVKTPPNKTMHLIIDEAHNILSNQSKNEQASWKDYRMELFEEIIKEGRKFGMYLTIASQRPADISPTIVSQIHNFFIHRLVNDRDLFLLENTITTLDNLSRSMIPHLSKGSCVITGSSFDLPMVLQVDRLNKSKRPDSEDVDLNSLWSCN